MLKKKAIFLSQSQTTFSEITNIHFHLKDVFSEWDQSLTILDMWNILKLITWCLDKHDESSALHILYYYYYYYLLEAFRWAWPKPGTSDGPNQPSNHSDTRSLINTTVSDSHSFSIITTHSTPSPTPLLYLELARTANVPTNSELRHEFPRRAEVRVNLYPWRVPDLHMNKSQPTPTSLGQGCTRA